VQLQNSNAMTVRLLDGAVAGPAAAEPPRLAGQFDVYRGEPLSTVHAVALQQLPSCSLTPWVFQCGPGATTPIENMPWPTTVELITKSADPAAEPSHWDTINWDGNEYTRSVVTVDTDTAVYCCSSFSRSFLGRLAGAIGL
jgi:hypothetical protein